MKIPTEEQVERWLESVPTDFPTFSSDDFSFARDDDAADACSDTLYSDTTGDGVELAYGLFEYGLGGEGRLVECLAMDPDDEWNSTPWGNEILFTIEAIAASAGQPSRDPELAVLRRWGAKVDFQPPSDMVDSMIGTVDFIMERYRNDPEKHDVNPEYLDEVLAAGALMRNRIMALKTDG